MKRTVEHTLYLVHIFAVGQGWRHRQTLQNRVHCSSHSTHSSHICFESTKKSINLFELGSLRAAINK